MKPNLLPCPFCGSGPSVKHRAESHADGGGFIAFVACFCGGYSATTHQFGHGAEVQSAVKAACDKWNTRAKSTPAEVAQGEVIHQWEFADAWMDTDEAGAASARCEGYTTRIVYTAPPSPDAELVELLREASQWFADRDIDINLARDIDAKLASLEVKP